MTTPSAPQSAPAQGSQVSVADSPAIAPDGPSRGHVLVVDDEELLRESLGSLLDEHGYRVSVADNGREALRQLRAGLLPDLIVLDLRMPIMDGWEFRAIQKADPTLCLIPIVALSADGSAQAAAVSAHAYLRRPVEPKALLGTIERVMGETAAKVANRTGEPRLTVAASARRGLATRGRILVIDDETLVGRIIARAFKDDLEVCVAESESGAMTLLEGDKPFGAVLCEMNLPDSNGPRIYIALAARWPELVPSLVFTCAGALTPTAAAFIERTSTPVLPKPFRIDQLRRTVLDRLRAAP